MIKTLYALLLAASALPALAHGHERPQAPVILLAQMSPEERRALRERWEQAGPEERADMRRALRERQRGRGEGGYGTGYERRQYEDEQAGSQPTRPEEYPYRPGRRP